MKICRTCRFWQLSTNAFHTTWFHPEVGSCRCKYFTTDRRFLFEKGMVMWNLPALQSNNNENTAPTEFMTQAEFGCIHHKERS